MPSKRDYYQVLGVPKNASEDDIVRAFRKIAKKTHPDVRPGDEVAAELFKEVGEAYGVLSDPEKRQMYDRGEPEEPESSSAEKSSLKKKSDEFSWFPSDTGLLVAITKALKGDINGELVINSPAGDRFRVRRSRGKISIDRRLDDLFPLSAVQISLQSRGGPKSVGEWWGENQMPDEDTILLAGGVYPRVPFVKYFDFMGQLAEGINLGEDMSSYPFKQLIDNI